MMFYVWVINKIMMKISFLFSFALVASYAMCQDIREPLVGSYLVSNSPLFEEPFFVEVIINPDSEMGIKIRDTSVSHSNWNLPPHIYYSNWIDSSLNIFDGGYTDGHFSEDTVYLQRAYQVDSPGGSYIEYYNYFGVKVLLTPVNEHENQKDPIMALFDLAGKEIPELRRGLNIVIYQSGRRERVFKE
jgi:hypothetical protein